VIAGQLEIDLVANVARLVRDMDQARTAVEGAMGKIDKAVAFTKAGLQTLGVTLTAGALVAFVKNAIDAADGLNKLAQRTGIATEQLSQLQYAAKLADVSHDSLNTAIKKLNVSIAEGRAGDQQKINSFKALGITTQDLGKGTVSVMLKIADAYAKAKDGAGKVENATKLMGKAGDEMIPLLNGGAQALRDLMAEADKLGLTISGDFAEKAEAFNDNLTRIGISGQKLAIILGTDVVEGLGKAAQAMADATVEGGKFHGIMTGLYVLLYGDGQHQNNVAIVDAAEKILNLQNAIDRARANGDTARVSRLQGLMTTYQREYAAVQKTAKGYEDQAAAAKAAADAAKKARDQGADIKGENTAATSAYDALIKRINERIDADKQQLKYGRDLTEQEKFEIKVRSDLQELMKKYPGISQAGIEKKLAEAKATALNVQQMQQELGFAKQIAQQVMTEDAEMAAFDKQRADRRDQVNRAIADQADALADSNEQLKLEATLMGATDAERSLALEKLRIEQDLKKQLKAINEDLLLTEQARAAAIASAQTNAAQAMQNAQLRSDLQEQAQLWGKLDDIGRDFWRDMLTDGKHALDNLGRSLKHLLIDELAKAMQKQWTMQIAPAIFGGGAGGAGGAGLLGQLGSLFGIGGAASAAGGAAGGAGAAGAGGAAAGAGPIGWMAMAAMLNMQIDKKYGLPWWTTAALPGAGVFLSLIGAQKAGGPKTEGGFGPGVDNRGDTANAQQLAQGIQATYQTIADALGLVNNKIDVSLFYAKDPKGDAKTQLQVLSANYNRGTAMGGIENVGRDDADLQKALDLSSMQDVFSELKAAIGKEGLTGQFADLINSVNPLTASLEDMQKVLDKAQVVAAFDRAIGALAPMFSNLTALSLESKDALTQAVGGLQNLTAMLGSFYNDFYSETEKQDQIWKSLVKTYTEANAVLPSTRDAFRAAVEAAMAIGDTATLGLLLRTEAAFNELYPAIQATADATQNLADLQKQMLDDARSNLMDAYGREENALQGVIDKNRGYIDSLKALQKALTTGPLAQLSPEAAYQRTRDEFLRIMALPANSDERLSGLPSAAEAFLQASQQYNASSVAYFQDLDMVLAATQASKTAAEANVDVAQLQLNAMKSQLEMLGLIHTDNLTFQQALAAYLGVKAGSGAGSGGTGAGAGGFNSSGGYTTVGGGVSIGSDQVQQIIATNHGISGAEQAYFAAYGQYIPAGIFSSIPDAIGSWSQSQLAQWVASNAPGHASGLWNVPHDDYLMRAHRGEAVLTAGEANDWRGGGGEVAGKLDVIAERVETLTRVVGGYAVADLRNGSSLTRNTQRSAQAAHMAYTSPNRARNEVAKV
jgi:hypothetical protein